MLRFSKKVEYAFISLLHISRKSTGELTTAKELSLEYNIPQELTGKVLQRLARTGFIRSVQGVKGGYLLDRPIDQMSLNGVVSAIEGPMRIVNCVEHDENELCSQSNHCNIKSPMKIIQRELHNFFNQITVKDLQQQMAGGHMQNKMATR
jgi:Rrf2 family protein